MSETDDLNPLNRKPRAVGSKMREDRNLDEVIVYKINCVKSFQYCVGPTM